MSQQTIDLGQLSLEQLASIKSQLDEEIQHLTTSYATLQAAQARFRRGKEAVEALPGSANAKPVLVPLTASLYVPGRLKDPESVIVDVGTGYYVRKNLTEAKTYYNSKVLELRRQTDQLQPAIEKKQEDRSIITSLLQQRLSERERARPKSQSD